MVSITPILAAKPGNQRAGIHIGVEKVSSRTVIAFDNNLTSKFMTNSINLLHIVGMCPLSFGRFLHIMHL